MTEIADLFARDPLSLTRENYQRIIAEFRGKRALFLQGVKAPRAKPVKGPTPELSLDDLEL